MNVQNRQNALQSKEVKSLYMQLSSDLTKSIADGEIGVL